MKHKITELIIDPSSGELSLSRLALGVLVIDCIALSLAEPLGYKFGNWTALAAIVGSVAGVYGVNTGLRVRRGKVLPEE